MARAGGGVLLQDIQIQSFCLHILLSRVHFWGPGPLASSSREPYSLMQSGRPGCPVREAPAGPKKLAKCSSWG